MTNPLNGFNEIVSKLASPKMNCSNHHLIHAAMGLASESGEVLDAVKAHLFYGKPIDKVNLVEEAGDICWFLSLLLQQFDLTIEQAVAGTKAKLQQRYGSEFNQDGALNRDKGKEMQALIEAVWGIKEIEG